MAQEAKLQAKNVSSGTPNLPYGGDDDFVVPAKEAARIQNKSQSTLAKERMRGDGCPFVKSGRRVGYRLGDLRRHIASNVRRSTAEERVGP